MPRSIYRCLGLLVACWLLSACSLIAPYIPSDSYEIQADDGVPILVEFDRGKGVSRLRQRDVILDHILDLSRDPERLSAAFDAMLELEALFEDSGYPLAEVSHQVIAGSPTKVLFKIQKGPRVTVKALRIEGNRFATDADLQSYWTRKQTRVLGFGDDLYIAEDIEALAKAIGNYYRRAGFLDVEVKLLPLEPPLRIDNKEVTVTIQIQENSRYKLGSLQIEPELARALESYRGARPKVGDPFLSQRIRDFALSANHYLRRHGHFKPEVLTTIKPDRRTRTVEVRVHGDAGPRVTVSRIDVRGQGFVTESNIRERIELAVGELFDGKKEEDSVLRLYRSGLFRRVEVEHALEGTDKIVVTFVVEESERYLLQPLVGWGSYEELRGGVEFEMLSVLGTGFDFTAKTTVSDKGYRAVAALSDTEFLPELFGYDTTFSIAADAFEREEPSFTDGAIGISPSLAHIFTTKISGRVAYIYREHGDATSSVIDPGAFIGDYTEGSALAEVTYDSRDNPLLPKRGGRFSAQYKFYDEALGSDVSFERVRFTGSRILPITDNTRFVVRAEAAWLSPKDGTDAIPIQERFFNGGEITVRSFREDALAPSELRDVNGQAIGGEFRNIVNVELRWAPPIQPMKAVGLEFALFGDAGNVGRSVDDYGLADMRYGVGAGVRFLLPIGPVRFDAGHNPDREPGERSWVLHFSIGYPF